MIAILEWTQSNAQQNIEQSQTPTMGVTINKKVNNDRTTAVLLTIRKKVNKLHHIGIIHATV